LYVDLVAHPGIRDDTSVTENIEESEDIERFCLDFDDQDVEMEETDECIIHGSTGNPFDFDELDYSNYNMLPISVEQADDVASTLDKLVKRGKIKKDGIFYKYLKGVLQVYITPTEYTWDDEVIEFFKTLKWLGGQSTVNMIRGPMWHGEGRGGVFNPDKMVPNLGGPSDRTLTKHSGGYTTESGILSPLMKTFHDIVDKEESTVVNCEVLKVVSVHAENDGTALKPGLQFDPTQKVVVGLANGNIKIDYIDNNKEKSPELTQYLKENIATEAVVTLLTNSPKTSFLSVGVSYHSQKGKTGENLKENLVKEVMQMQCCRGCLEKCLSNITIQCECCESSVCNICLSLKSVCDKCQDDGQISYHPSIRACRSCLENNTKCVKCIVLTWSVDCESGNRKMIDLVAVEPITHLEYLVAFPDVVHLAKTYKCSWSNWFLILGEGDRSTLGTLRMLRNESSSDVVETLHRLLTAESVRNKDRMAVEPLLQLTSQKLLDYLTSIKDAFITMNLLPDRYRISETNKRGLYEHPFAICLAGTGKLIFLNWNSKNKSSDLVQLRLHSPTDSTVLQRNLETNGLSLCYMNGVALFCGQEEIQYVDIEG
jgi:hypothetical protein